MKTLTKSLLIIFLTIFAFVTNVHAETNGQTYVVTSAEDWPLSSGIMTLRKAIDLANNSTGEDTITFSLGGNDIVDLSATHGTLLITDDVIIQGYSNRLPNVDGADAMRLFEIADGVNVTFENITLRNGTVSSGEGGAIMHGTGDLYLLNVHLDSSEASSGGALSIGGGDAFISQSDITNSEATVGGGVYVGQSSFGNDNSANLTLIETTIAHNEASSAGGGIFMSANGVVSMNTNSALSDNSAGEGGGIVITSGGYFTFEGGTIERNVATNDGGAISNHGEQLYIEAYFSPVVIRDNVAGAGNGGAIYDVSDVDLVIAADEYPVTISGNSAGDNGGAVYAAGSAEMRIRDGVVFADNSAENHGGAIYQSGGNFSIWSSTTRSLISGNSTTTGEGGAIYLQDVEAGYGSDGYWPGIWSTDLVNNTASAGYGGAIYTVNTALSLIESRVIDNAARKGGGLYADTASVIGVFGSAEIIDATSSCDPLTLPANTYCSEFRGNSAENLLFNRGGGILAKDAYVSVERVAFIDNSAYYGAAIGAEADSWLTVNTALFHDNDVSGNYVIESNNNVPDATPDLNIKSSTFVDNSATAVAFNAQSGNFFVQNSIFWNNDAGVTLQNPDVFYAGCNIAPEANIGSNVDPQFVTTGRGNYRLASTSPAIDQCLYGETYDLDNTLRPQDWDWDMGAFEYIYVPTAVTLAGQQTMQTSAITASIVMAMLGLMVVTLLLNQRLVNFVDVFLHLRG